MNTENITRCRKCGKVIVGNSKLGLCESCLNAEAEKAGFATIVLGLGYKFRKQIYNALKAVGRLFVH